MSTLKADTIQSTGGGAATLTKQEAAKSRVSATITSDTHTIQDSFNVASLTDDGAGKTDVVFTNNMNNDDYSATVSCGLNGSNMFAHLGANTLILTSEYRCISTNAGGTTKDYDVLCGTVHGDLT
tara:strand:- start:139 stop:513 length:375 start_codon:yes stop_codon:yes gene_type:complete